MTQPSFSVVIPTYNRAALIPKTLDTVLRQRYPAHEILVVDNCSTDDTEQVLAPLVRAGKIRYLRHERNFERARSRNTGMENATGDYVTFIDSDDLMYPDNLADAAAHVQQHGSPAFFHNLYELVDTEGHLLHRYRFPPLDDPRLAIMEGNFFSCIGAFLRRDLYQQYRFDTDPELTGSEDWEFWIRVVADHAPGRIGKVNSAIVQHGGRTVVQTDLAAVRKRLARVRDKVIAHPRTREVYGPYLNRLDVGSVLYLASVANSARRHGDALKLLLEGLRLDYRLLWRERFLRIFRIALLRVDQGS